MIDHAAKIRQNSQSAKEKTLFPKKGRGIIGCFEKKGRGITGRFEKKGRGITDRFEKKGRGMTDRFEKKGRGVVGACLSRPLDKQWANQLPPLPLLRREDAWKGGGVD